jgi:hypothetical protein
MARRRSLASQLYRAARLSGNPSALVAGASRRERDGLMTAWPVELCALGTQFVERRNGFTCRAAHLDGCREQEAVLLAQKAHADEAKQPWNPPKSDKPCPDGNSWEFPQPSSNGEVAVVCGSVPLIEDEHHDGYHHAQRRDTTQKQRELLAATGKLEKQLAERSPHFVTPGFVELVALDRSLVALERRMDVPGPGDVRHLVAGHADWLLRERESGDS